MVLHRGPSVPGSVPTMAVLTLHGPKVNFVFRMERLAGKLDKWLLLSEPASAGLRLGDASVVAA